MHESVMDFGRARLAPGDVFDRCVIEVGSQNINGSLRPHVESLRPMSYVGVDFVSGEGVDVVCDAGEIVARFGPNSFHVVISTEMLEHAQDWRAAVDAMKRVLVPGGVLLLTTRSPGFQLHGHPHDWHRFTLDDMAKIFADFQISALEADRQAPGVLALARKPMTWRPSDLDLSTIDVAPADEANAPR
jgi:SAM-dependent methyltransferase